ncbi:uncharacterized protein LOC143986785 [Lithobates pipiens]
MELALCTENNLPETEKDVHQTMATRMEVSNYLKPPLSATSAEPDASAPSTSEETVSPPPLPETTPIDTFSTTPSPSLDTTPSPSLNTTTSPSLDTTTSPLLDTTTSPSLDTTTSPSLYTTTSPSLNTTTSPSLDTTSPSLDTTPPTLLDTTSPLLDTTPSTSTPTSLNTTTSVSSSNPSSAGLDLTIKLSNYLEKACSNFSGPDLINSLGNLFAKADPVSYSDHDVQLILNIIGNVTSNGLQLNFKFNVDTVNQAIFIISVLIECIDTADLNLQWLQSIENMFSTTETTFENFPIAYPGIDFSCTVFNPDGLNESISVELLSGATVSLSTEILKKIDKSSEGVINVLSMIYAPTNGSFNLPYESSDNLSYFLDSFIWTNVAIVNNKSEHSLNIYMNFTHNDIMSNETADLF